MDVAQSFAATFVDELAAQGLEHACVSPGSRSAPLAMALARHPGIHVFMQVDERSGSFFALGLAKATGRPVALLCTSGTAAAEFHPAVVEGFHSRTPLLVLTADRPPELRGVGANQAIDQARIYGGAVRWSFDPGPPTETEPGLWRRLAARALAEATGPPAGPVHLNLPFREPLTPEPGRPPAPLPAPSPRIATGPRAAVGAKELAAALVAAERPLVVAGELRPGQRLAEPLGRLLQLSGAALFAEPSSQLRRAGLPGLVEAYEPLIRVPRWAAAHQPDLVLRLGATPTSRPLNEWLAQAAPRTFLIDPDAAWLDPDHAATDVLRCDEMALLEDVLPSLRKRPLAWQRELAGAGSQASAALEAALNTVPLHEGHTVRALAAVLPDEATIFAGSSLPIRDVDVFWPAAAPGHRFYGNRGASGIDGLVSTGLGVAAAGAGPAAILLGDLSLYHDMNGLWSVRRHRIPAVFVVLDNGGGGIFDFLPPAEHEDVFEEVFATPLALRLEDVARLYGLDHCRVREAAALRPALSAAFRSGRPGLVVAEFDRRESVRGHRACWQAVADAIGG